MVRWLELLSEFDYRVIHWPGAQHLNADCHATLWYILRSASRPSLSSAIFPIWTVDEIKEMQSADSNLQQFVQWVESESFPGKFPKLATPQVQALWNQ